MKIIYIDDDKKDLADFSEIFKNIKVDGESITTELIYSNQILKEPDIFDRKDVDLILVDFNLDQAEYDEIPFAFDGITLTTLLRQKFPSVPIVLFTRPDMFKKNMFSAISPIITGIDDYVYKEDYLIPDKAKNGVIFQINEGYRTLRRCSSKKLDDLLDLVKVPDEDQEIICKTFPKASFSEMGHWSEFPVAKWVRKTLMEYPGLLYDDLHAATCLGISVDAFNKVRVQAFFDEARYKGIFSDERKLWWKSQLKKKVDANMNKKEISLDFREGFQVMWKRLNKESLEVATCCYSKESPAEWVCYLLKEPVMLKYSLKYYGDNRPSYMDEMRVSFKAIREEDDIIPELIDPKGRIIFDKLVNGK